MDYTLKQCADKAKLGQSTARFYKEKYLEYFTTSGEGRATKYAENTVDILLLIAKSYKDKLDYDQIKEVLDGLYGVNVSTSLVEQGDNNNTVVVQQNELIEIIHGLRDSLESVVQTVERLEKKSDVVAERHDRLLMESLRLIGERNRKWWRFGR